ncbi:MAG: methyltransferase [Streptosporangiales bacterium]|nr:methyltransferase [Streptosporangiales bacterium]
MAQSLIRPVIEEIPTTQSVWPAGFERVPDEEWTRQDPDEFGLKYDEVDQHGWYKNLEPTVAQVLTCLDENEILLDYSGGTGILGRRILPRIQHPAGILIADTSPKFLRVAMENFRDDERVAFRLIRWLKDQKRLQSIDEVLDPSLLDRKVDVLTSTNAIHLYYNLEETLQAWHRVLRPGGHVLVSSGNLINPRSRKGEWIIDETVRHINEIAIEVVRQEPAFEQYRAVLDDPTRMDAHRRLREKVFVPVRPLDFYLRSFEETGFTVLDVFEMTIFAGVEEWAQLLRTYHDGALSWVGGSEKVEGQAPSADALRDRLFLIRYALEKLFTGRDEFECCWTYITCQRRGWRQWAGR